MGLMDNIKNIFNIPSEDEYDDEDYETEEATSKDEYDDEDYEPETPKRERAESPRIIKRSSAVKGQTSAGSGRMQVVLVKPNCFDDVTAIADHLNAGRTVVLNLEDADKDVSRRIVDFLSGVAYANNGNMRKVAVSTFIIVARNVDVMGELMLDDFDDGKMYF